MDDTQTYLDPGLPDGLVMNNTGTGLEITRKWFSVLHIFTAFFALVWCGFLVFWYSILASFSAPGEEVPHFLLIFYLFPLIHVAVGIGLLYYSLCGFVNKTTISVDWENLRIKHHPLPWRGNRTIPRSDVKQLYVKRQESRTRNGTSITYDINLITQSGRDIKLVKGLPADEQARFIEREVEKYLHIENVPVRGENA